MQTALNWFNFNRITFPSWISWEALLSAEWASVVTILVLIILLSLLFRWRRKRLAPKKAALRLLTMPLGYQTPSSAIELLRQTALCYYPHEDIAHLKGSEWYAFLDTQLEQPRFVPNLDLWQQALCHKRSIEHPEKLVADCHFWIENALPPKKQRRDRLSAKQP